MSRIKPLLAGKLTKSFFYWAHCFKNTDLTLIGFSLKTWGPRSQSGNHEQQGLCSILSLCSCPQKDILLLSCLHYFTVISDKISITNSWHFTSFMQTFIAIRHICMTSWQMLTDT